MVVLVQPLVHPLLLVLWVVRGRDVANLMSAVVCNSHTKTQQRGVTVSLGTPGLVELKLHVGISDAGWKSI